MMFPRTSIYAQEGGVRSSESRLRADVAFLADDRLEGRGVGTGGIEEAADFIADRFERLGLTQAPGLSQFSQPFEIDVSPQLVAQPRFRVDLGDRTRTIDPRDYSPLALGGSATVDSSPIVFAGYGISVPSGSPLAIEYDDYRGLDVEGKIVVVLRGEPQIDDPSSPFAGRRTTVYSRFSEKLLNARKHGATGLILVNSRVSNSDLIERTQAGIGSAAQIPFCKLNRIEFDRLLELAGAPTLNELESSIDARLLPQSFLIEGLRITLRYRFLRDSIKARNIVGVLEGEGPLSEETIIVGGHYDHLGFGGRGSRSPGRREIHNGADDNASGTALVMELAQRLVARPDPLPRRVVFALFSGEERGLLGSKRYVEDPPFPLTSTIAMLNYDMIGRLEDDRLEVLGTGSAPDFEDLIRALGRSSQFKVQSVRSVNDGRGGSDHQPFFVAGVPVLFLHTGLHEEYHRPSDDFETINFPGMVRIANLSELLLLNLARRPVRPQFVRDSR